MACVVAFCAVLAVAKPPHVFLDQIQLGEGFSVSVFASNISFARSLDVSAGGTVFISTFNFLNISGESGARTAGFAHAVLSQARTRTTTRCGLCATRTATALPTCTGR